MTDCHKAQPKTGIGIQQVTRNHIGTPQKQEERRELENFD